MTFILGAAVTLFLLLAGAEVLFNALQMPVAAILCFVAGYAVMAWIVWVLWTTSTLWWSQLSRFLPRGGSQRQQSS
jgi:hypothetical protein